MNNWIVWLHWIILYFYIILLLVDQTLVQYNKSVISSFVNECRGSSLSGFIGRFESSLGVETEVSNGVSEYNSLMKNLDFAGAQRGITSDMSTTLIRLHDPFS